MKRPKSRMTANCTLRRRRTPRPLQSANLFEDSHLTEDRKLSTDTINSCISALKRLYLNTLEMPWTDEYFPHVKRATRLQVVLSQEEMLLFFDHVAGLKNRAALMLCYGAGLRISETLSLKIGDIDSKRMLIRVDQGKGQCPQCRAGIPIRIAILPPYRWPDRPPDSS